MKIILISLFIVIYGTQATAQTCVSDSFDRAYEALHKAQKDYVTNWGSRKGHRYQEVIVNPKVVKLKATDSVQIMFLYRNLISKTTTYIECMILSSNNFFWDGLPFDTLSPKMLKLQNEARGFVAREVKLEPLAVLSKAPSESLIRVSLNHPMKTYSIDQKTLLFIYLWSTLNTSNLYVSKNDPTCIELLKQIKASDCKYAKMLVDDY